ncbi:MAG: FG-GAP repeat protein [Wenzhouxiangellaceae bacterium]|nr:FG-GAP repeat protein [Wenzhouxiangellaceae bacterium]
MFRATIILFVSVSKLCALQLLSASAPALAVTSGMPVMERPVAAQPALPEGLDERDWQAIQAQVVAHSQAKRFQAVPAAARGAYTAANPVHSFAIRYAADGATELALNQQDSADATAHRIALKPVALGYGKDLVPLSGPQTRTAAGVRVDTLWTGQLREWWINDVDGLEQWFELAAPPAGRGDAPLAAHLRLELALDSSLNAALAGSGDRQHLLLHDDATRVRFEKLLVEDATGRRLPAKLELGRVRDAHRLAYVIDDRGAVYPLTIDPIFVQQAYLKASNSGAGDFFGGSVAVSGDTVVVGARGEDSSATGVDADQGSNASSFAGAAYVFVRDGSGAWSQQAYLKASNTGASDEFGFSVALSSDTLVVGARFEDSNATGVNGDQASNAASAAGAAYVFVRDGSGIWSQQAYLKASNTGPGDEFGFSVALSGDTLVVGARGEDSNATGVNGDQVNNEATTSGAAYVFVRDGSGIWSQQAYLKASNTDALDQFGSSVAVSGDTLVVGAPDEDSRDSFQRNNAFLSAGAAYVFVREGSGAWSQQAYLKASNADADDQFGESVAVSGDTVVVGARGEDSNATGVNGDQVNNEATTAGAAYVFVRDGSGIWSQQAYLKPSNTDANDQFGFSVALSGDTLVVGARGEDSNTTGIDGDQGNNAANDSGAAYVFVREGSGAWSQQAYLKASNTGASDRFGESVSISGDTVVVGALFEDSNTTGVDGDQGNNAANDSGAAYVFDLAFKIGGSVTGLDGNGLVLRNNGGDDLTIAADGPFTFPTALNDGSGYTVTVATQPATLSQTCAVTNGSGTLAGADVANVQVTCTTNTFTVGGTVTGLEGSGLVLQNNGGDTLSILEDGAFTFSTALKDGESYSVAVSSRPTAPKQVCSVTNGEGKLSGEAVSNIAVGCLRGYSVSGTVSGVRSPGLVIDLNNKSALLFEQDADFTFPLWLKTAETWGVQILFEPDLHTCTVSPASGIYDGSDVEGVAVECSTNILFKESFEDLSPDPIEID